MCCQKFIAMVCCMLAHLMYCIMTTNICTVNNQHKLRGRGVSPTPQPPNPPTPQPQTPEGYIKGYLYPILYPKISKKDISVLFWSRIFWGYNILFLRISKYHIHILSYFLFSAFSARDFGFQRQDFSFSTAVSAISAVICHFLAALLIDQGFNSIQ
jgi:hypothetical protein